jgi:hypothetical protein
VLSRRVVNWQTRLLSNHPNEARAALDQLLSGRVVVWGTAGDWETEGFDPNDRRGRKNLEPADCLSVRDHA